MTEVFFAQRLRATRKELSYISCWVAVVGLAAVLRFPTISAGLPYIDYVDEGYVLHQSIELLNQRSLDTRWYGYPSLPAYLTAATLIAYSPIYRAVHGHGFRKDLPNEKSIHTESGDNYDLISPVALIIAGRLVTIILSVGTVALVGAVAASLAGKRVVLLSMALADCVSRFG